jgi:hypothetical protein
VFIYRTIEWFEKKVIAVFVRGAWQSSSEREIAATLIGNWQTKEHKV